MTWWNPQRRLAQEVPALGLPDAPTDLTTVTDADIAALPEPAQRFLRYRNVVGRPRDWSFLAHFRGRFRPTKSAAWQEMTAYQYSSAAPRISRSFYMILHFGGLPFLGRDTYIAGKGRLLVRALDMLTVQDGVGEPFDLGELVTWVNDAVLIAPSMLLGPHAHWSSTDTSSFDVSVTDQNNTVRAHISIDADGAVTDFLTADRWYAPPGKKPERTTWSTPVEGWARAGDRVLPTAGQAVWKLPDGDLPYADFHFSPNSITFNVAPGACAGINLRV